MASVPSYCVVKRNTATQYDDINNFISKYKGQSGIIYCISRRQCEEVAAKLRRNYNIRTEHYHAQMSAEERAAVQKAWQRGNVDVIVATIAFGMGIDKANVRFVIHYSMPSSVEGYYQETGRAGRDGLPAECRLYYSYRDTMIHRVLIENGDGDQDQKERLRENLNRMVQFCENETDCRRQQILSYFGEHFDPMQCAGTCDNCSRNQNISIVSKDLTTEAQTVIKIIRQIQTEYGDKATLNQLRDLLRGSQGKRIRERGYTGIDGFGAARHLDRTAVDRLLKHLVINDVIVERPEQNAKGFTTSHVHVSCLL